MWPSPASGSGDSSGNDAEPRFTDAGSKTSRGGEPIDEAEFNEHHDEYLDKDDIPGLYPHHEEAEAASETVDVGEEGGQRAIDDTWFVDPAYEDKPPPRSAGADNEFVPLWIQRAKVNLEEGSSPLGGVLLGDNLPLVDKCMAQLEAGHARDVVDLDVRETCDWTNRMIIAESASTKHMHALADDLVRTIKVWMRRSNLDPSKFILNVDGKNSDDWVVIDLGDVFIHIMTPEARAKYDLETLWGKGEKPTTDAGQDIADEQAT